MSMCRVFSCVVGRGCLLWPVHFLGKTLLVFALLHSAFQGQICLLLHGRKVMTNLDSIFKSRDITFVIKGMSSQGSGFYSSQVWMWELDYKESRVPKNWCFWTVVLEKTLVSPLDCKISNQSILKEISPGCSLEGLMLKLKLQYFGHLMWTADLFEKTMMLGKIEGRRRRGRQRMRWSDGITNSMDFGHEFE